MISLPPSGGLARPNLTRFLLVGTTKGKERTNSMRRPSRIQKFGLTVADSVNT